MKSILAAFLALVSLSFEGVCQPYSKENPLRVGAILPLTGDAANFGTATKNGMQLAYENLSPGIKEKIKLTFEDDGFVPSRSVSAFSKLRTIEKIALLINAGSATGKALSVLAERESVPFLAVASDPEVVRQRQWVMNFWVTPDEEVKLLIPEALKRGYKKIARISTVHAFPVAIKQALDAQSSDLKTVLDEDYLPEVKDFKPYLSKIKTMKDVDAILPILMPGQLGIFAKQAREMGIELPLFGFEFFEDPAEVKASNGALVGGWYANAGDPNSEFIKRYLSMYPSASLFSAGNGHDLVLLIAEIVRRQLSMEEANAYLHTLKDFHGSLGAFSASGRNTFTLPATLKIVTKDGFAPLN